MADQDLAAFYNIRGQNSLAAMNSGKNLGIPLHISAPYEHAYQFLELIKGNKTMLDLGCGAGLHSVKAAQMGYSVVGVDISPISIQAAKTYSQAMNVENRCKFRCHSVDALGADEKFDVIFAAGVVYYFSHSTLQKVIQENLRPGGYIVFVEPLSCNPIIRFYRFLRNKIRSYRDTSSIENLLSWNDLQEFRNYFEIVELRGFDFLTLLGGPLKRVPFVAQAYQVLAKSIDRVLLKYFRFLSFKAVCLGRKPLS